MDLITIVAIILVVLLAMVFTAILVAQRAKPHGVGKSETVVSRKQMRLC